MINRKKGKILKDLFLNKEMNKILQFVYKFGSLILLNKKTNKKKS